VLVLRVDLVAHSAAELVEALGGTVESICNMLAKATVYR
jgi:hypothetical protein